MRLQFGKAETTSHQSANCDIDDAITFPCSSGSVNHCEALEDKANNVLNPLNDRRLIKKSYKSFSTPPLHKGT